MDDKYVYLAGPIKGHRYEDAMAWRREAAEFLHQHGIRVLVPTTSPAELVDLTDTPEASKLYQVIPDTDPWSSHRAIVGKDFYYVSLANVLLMNFTQSPDLASIGSTSEISWAFALKMLGQPKFTVSVIPEGNIHEHAFIREQSDMIVSTLEVALDSILHLLSY